MVTESASWQTFWGSLLGGGWSRGGSDSLPETRNSEKLPERHTGNLLEVYTVTPPRKCPRNVHQYWGKERIIFQPSFFRRELLVERGSSACKVRHYQQ